MGSERFSPWSCHGVSARSRCLKQQCFKQPNIMKKIYLALRFPAVWPKAPTVSAGGSLQKIYEQGLYFWS